jgi:uncharacterized protein (DUF427 family)
LEDLVDPFERPAEQLPADVLAMLPRPFDEPTDRWVRVTFGGRTIADSRRARLLVQYGPGRLPTYFFPLADVDATALAGERARDGRRVWDLHVGELRSDAAAWSFVTPPASLEGLTDHLTFSWHRVDAWYEEAEEVFVHARDPHSRVDVLRSTRHVEVSVDGVVIADSHRPHLLFETTLPTRYYLPLEDVRMDRLEPSPTTSRCPYKGTARYWTLVVGDDRLEDVAWSYPAPIPENPRIAGLVAFFTERVDVRVDGELQPRPRSPWS